MVWAEVAGTDRPDIPTQIDVHDAVQRELMLFTDLDGVSRERSVRIQLIDTRRRCGTDTSCIRRDLTDRNVELGLVITVDGSLSPPLVSARLLERDGADRVAVGEAEGVGPILETSAALARKVLIAAGGSLGSVLIVDVDPPDAAIDLKPDARALVPRTLVLTPGSYRVRASRPGYESVERVFAVSPGERASLSLRLEESTPITSSPWFWGVTGGVVVAGAIVGAVVALRPRSYVVCTAADINMGMCQ